MFHALSHVIRRREKRQQVEMLVHFSRGGWRSTIMLKDLTCRGARIEGVGGLIPDEAVSLTLPGCKPQLAFVVWAKDHCAGLEFAVPLDAGLLNRLTLLHAVGRSVVAARPCRPAAAA